jgi:formamidopyrimidine-DNA glycosylase
MLAAVELDVLREQLEGPWSGELLKDLIIQDSDRVESDILEKVVLGVERKGPWIVFSMSQDWNLLFQPSQFASYRTTEGSGPLRFHLIGQSNELYVYEKEKTVRLRVSRVLEPVVGFVGPDALDATELEIKALLLARYKILSRETGKHPVFHVLTDDTLLSGTGSHYVNELLWKLGIHPERRFRVLTRTQIDDLSGGLRVLLDEAREAGGVLPLLDGEGGGYRGVLSLPTSLSSNTGATCAKCATILSGIPLYGKQAIFCSTCQPT